MFKRLRLFFILVFLYVSLVNTGYSQCTAVPIKEAIVNGDFESGNSGFTNGMTYKLPGCAGGCWSSENIYTISNTPEDLCQNCSFTFTGDHTTGTGKAMYIDGPNDAGKVLWQQTVNITTFQTYYFSAWVALLIDDQPAIIQFYIDGVPLGAPFDFFGKTKGQYNQISAQYVNTTNTSVILSMVSQKAFPTVMGNDFVIDDISFINGCQNTSGGAVKPNLGANQNLCSTSGTITLNSGIANLGQYNWYEGTGATQIPLVQSSGTSFTNPTVSSGSSVIINKAGTYRVCFDDGVNCAASSTVVVDKTMTVAIPDANLNCYPPTTVSVASTSTASTGTKSYAWSVPAGMTNPGNVANASADRAGTYTVTVTNTNVAGCTASDNAAVTLTNNMSIAMPDAVLCSPAVATLDAVLNGAYMSYVWSVPGGATNPGNARTASANLTGTYAVTATATSAAGWTCTATDNAIVTSTLPTFTQPAIQCYGANVVVNGTGTNVANYRWYSAATGGVLLGSGASPTFTMPASGTDVTVYLEDATTMPVAGSPLLNSALGAYGNWGNTTMDLTISKAVKLQTVKFKQEAWTGSCGASGSANVVITLIQGGSTLQTVNTTVTCGGETTGSLNFDLTPGNYQLKIVGAAGNANPYFSSTAYSFTAASLPGYVSVTNCNMPGNYEGPFAAFDFQEIMGCARVPVVIPIHSCCTPPSGVTITGPAVCAGSTLSFTSSGTPVAPAVSVSYSWAGPVAFSAAIANPTRAGATTAMSGTYTVTITDNLLCKTTTTIAVTVNALPTASITGTNTICAGASTTLTAAGGTTYSWDNASTAANRTVTPASTTTYTVTATSNSCTDTKSIVVTVTPLPTANAGTSVSICKGASTNLLASGGTTYQWNGGPATAAYTVTPVSTTTYTVTATTSGCSSSDSLIVTVKPIPTANAGTSISICAGTSTNLLATGGTTYQWNGAGPATAAYSVTPATTTTYTVTATTNGCSSSDSLIVTVKPLPTANAGTSVSICAGASTNLLATGGTTYQWNGGSATAAYTVTPLVTTTYTVTATTNGCSSSDSLIVTIKPLPTANAGTSVSICAGASTNLLATGGTSYQWNGAGPATAAYAVTPASTTTYTVTATTNGCSSSDSLIITVKPLPTANAGTSVSICIGASTNLLASGGTTYQWNGGPATAAYTVTPALTTTYTVTATTNGCSSSDSLIVIVKPLPTANAGASVSICAGASTNLLASGGTAYQWNGGPATAAYTVTPALTTTYTVTATTNGCSSSDSFIVTVKPLPTTNAGTSVSICAGLSTNLLASGGATYQWNGTGSATAAYTVTPATTTTYTVTATTNGCSSSDSLIVTVKPLPTTNAGISVSVCIGSSTTLSASGGTTYQWNGGPATASYPVSPASTTTYTVTATTNGCSSSDSLIVSVIPIPTANAGISVSICAGTSTTLSASGGTTYQWGGGPATSTYIVSPATTTTYTVTASTNGCSSSDTLIVTVKPLPIVNAGTSVSICAGLSTSLLASGGTTYQWNGAGPATAAYIVTPASTTTYTVTTTTNGCTASDSLIVTVIPLPTTNAGAGVSICIGASTLLNASGATSYQWSGGPTTSSYSVTPASTTIYTVTGTTNGCSSSDTLIVTVHVLPTVDAGGPYKTCKTASVMLNATQVASWTYAWSKGANGNLSVTNISNPSASHISPLTLTADALVSYTVTVTDAYGCSNSDNTVVTFELDCSPSVNLSATFTSICLGQATEIKADTHSVKDVKSFIWSEASFNSSNPINPVGPHAVTPTITTVYKATITDIFDSVDVATITITVNPLPTATVTSTAVCPGLPATLTAGGGIGYAWISSSGNTLTVSPAVAGNYTVTVTDANGCSDTESGAISINTIPAVNAGVDQVVCKTDAAVLTVTAATATAYLWANDVKTQLDFNNKATVNAELKNKVINIDESYIYTVTVTDGNTCTATDEVQVTYQAMCKPTVTIDGDPKSKLCLGESTTLKGSIISQKTLKKAEWIVDGVTSSATFTGTAPNYTVSDYPITPLLTTTYTLKATDNTDSEGQADIIITVNPLPTAVVPPVTVCPNTSATLTASGAGIGGTYAWSNITTGTTLTLNTAVASTYTVTVTDVNSCTDSEEGIIALFTPPALTPMLDKRTCKAAAITISPTTDPTWTYNWSSTPASSIVSPTSDVPTVSYLTPGTPNSDVTITYSVTITDANSCTSTDDIAVIYEYDCKPYIYPAATKYNLCEGESTVISATTFSQKPVTGIVWSEPSFNTTPPINPTGNFTITPLANTTITAYIYDDQGKGDTASITITVSPLPVADAGVDLTICAKDSKTLSVVNNGINGIQSVVWFDNNSSLISNTTVSPNVTTTYTAFITDIKGCKDLDDIIVNVNQLPAASAGNPVTICPGTSTTLSASGGISYSWSTGATTDINTQKPTVSPTTYKVTVTDANSCSEISQVIVQLHPKAVASAGLDKSTCVGQTKATLTATGGENGGNYLWNTGEQTPSIISNPLVAGITTYSVTVTTDKGCIDSAKVKVEGFDSTAANAGPSQTICAGKQATLQEANIGMNYKWSDAKTTQSITVSPVNTATYTVTITNTYVCTASDSLIVTVNQLPIASFILPVTAKCINDNSFTINTATAFANSTYWGKGVSGITFTPNVGGAGVDTIYYSFSDAAGCSNQTFATLKVISLPVIKILDPTICEGTSTTLSAGDGLTRNYIWDDGNKSASRLITPDSIGTNFYIVTVSEKVNNCSASDSVFIYVSPTPKVNLIDTPVYGCVPLKTVFSDSTYPAGAKFYWDFGDGDTAKSEKLSTINHTYKKAGTYSVIYKVTTAAGCWDSIHLVDEVTVLPIPVASFKFSPKNPTNSDPIVDFNDLSGGKVKDWYWNFDDPGGAENEIKGQRAPSHSFSKPGEFNVMLVVNTGANCIDTTYLNVKVTTDHGLFVPNAFTPNGDGINEVLLPQGFGIEEETFEFMIFTRWGELIYYSIGYGLSWDGRKWGKGEILPNDMFTWQARFKDLAGVEFEEIGAVMILH